MLLRRACENHLPSLVAATLHREESMPNGGEIDFRFSIASLYSPSCLRLEQLESSQRVRWR